MARRLRAAGHEVVVATAGASAPEGGTTFPAEDDRDPGSVAEEVAATLTDLPPDLCLIDLELPLHVIVAAGIGIPTATWTTMLSVCKRPGVPPPHTSIIPGEGAAGSPAGIELAWARYRAAKRIGAWRARIARRGADRISTLARIADRYGFPFAAEADTGQWLVPFSFRTIPTLSLNALELDWPHRPPRSFHYVGPMLGPPPTTTDHPALAEAYAAREAGRPLVYAAFGAWYRGDDAEFVRRVVAVAEERPTWSVVVGLGGRLDAEDLGPVPDNAIVLDWAPQREVLAHADAAIHHGGAGSLNECLAAGVPMVTYPLPFLEQPGNAARAVFHGLAAPGDREHDAPATIADRLQAVMDDAAFGRAARRMGTIIAGYATERRLEHTIGSLTDLARPDR
jgi:zeaxanthin glucosyltransferase